LFLYFTLPFHLISAPILPLAHETGLRHDALKREFMRRYPNGGFDQIGCEKGERDRHDAGLILSCRPSGLLDRHIRSFHALRPVGEALSPLADLRPASIGLPKNGGDGRVGEARRITFAVINVTDNVRGELSARVITVSELNRQKIARAIECDGHDAESVGIIDTTDVVRRDHFALPHGREGHFQLSSESKKRAISHPQMLSTINSTNPIPTNSTASATESYSSQCR
jgi:hypothetical protein